MAGSDPFLEAAIAEARAGLAEGGIPIGALIVQGDRILARGRNRRIQWGSVIRHGEMDALESLGRQPASLYRSCTLYTTLSPCPMCTGAILLYRIPRIVIGENRTFLGSEELLRSQGVLVEVRDDAECRELLASFIRRSPASWDEDIGLREGERAQGESAGS
ncbi:nucleoside deaminase [Methylacidimicrobium tartarophylax]|uniref:dCMP deaminase n=1 Tax=Methylacidimicrobium tartarophylax TaxID=1041768 RepID=A0A5E6MKP0_9BACT|nr:nucleoside deaminase [Methylacidimicrobium tartarophylax]VVM06617.1 dCMP deaminase [Methylacidimicrobium tartarophylax]